MCHGHQYACGDEFSASIKECINNIQKLKYLVCFITSLSLAIHIFIAVNPMNMDLFL